MARGLERAGHVPGLCPVADGGEGTMEVLLVALGGETAGATVSDPLGRPVNAGFALVEDGGTAIVELAQASSLALGEGRAEEASSRGTGELIAAAVGAGAEVVLVAAGGSATTDGGTGAIEAIAEAGGLRGARLVVLCDVSTPFEEAARRFGPQKGADAAALARLERRLHELADRFPRDPRGIPLTGAAGGLSGGLWAHYDAALEPGAAFILDVLRFDDRAHGPVVTGEGRLDATTLEGKAVAEIARRARGPVHAVVGQDALGPGPLGLASVQEASTLEEIEAAASRLKL